MDEVGHLAVEAGTSVLLRGLDHTYLTAAWQLGGQAVALHIVMEAVGATRWHANVWIVEAGRLYPVNFVPGAV